MAQVGNAKVSRSAPHGAKMDRARVDPGTNAGHIEPKLGQKPRAPKTSAKQKPKTSGVASALVFFREFLKSPAAIGSLLPTTDAIGRAITRKIGLESAEFVAEIGAGTGPITKHILRAIDHRRCTFFAVEINETLAAEFRRRYPDVRLVLGDALELRTLAAEVRDSSSTARDSGAAGLDAVVCAIPVSLLPTPARDGLFREVANALRPGGWFSLITYQLPITPKARELRKALLSHFDEVRTLPPVWGNVPPGFIIQARRN